MVHEATVIDTAASLASSTDQRHICQNLNQFGHGKGTVYGGCSEYTIIPARYAYLLTTDLDDARAAILERELNQIISLSLFCEVVSWSPSLSCLPLSPPFMIYPPPFLLHLPSSSTLSLSLPLPPSLPPPPPSLWSGTSSPGRDPPSGGRHPHSRYTSSPGSPTDLCTPILCGVLRSNLSTCRWRVWGRGYTTCIYSHVLVSSQHAGCGPVGLLAIGLAKVMGATKMYTIHY